MFDEPLRLRLANRLDALEPTRQAMEAFLARAEPTPRVSYKLELVLEEIFMNLLWHAFNDDAEHVIELTVQLHPDEVVLSFEDDGIAFDPTQAVDPVRPGSILDASTGGRGLMLVRRAARSVGYTRHEGRNRLRVAVALG